MKRGRDRKSGLALVTVSWVLLALILGVETPEERDVTVVLLTLPLGVYMLFTEEYILYP